MRTLTERIFSAIRESGTDGLTFEIVIIREGLSKNGTFYPAETLLKSRPLFEGAKVAFYEWKGIYDHLSEDQRGTIPQGFPSQVAGLLTDIKFKKLAEGDYGLVGTLKLTESNKWLADIFRVGLETGNKDVLGFSIDVLGNSIKETIDGKEVDKITEIGVVNEVTVVTNPAAGGRLERMVASVSQKKGRENMKEQLLRLIAALRPKKLDGISLTEAEESKVVTLAKEMAIEVGDQFKENRDFVVALHEAMSAVDGGDMNKVKESIQKCIDAYASMISAAMEAGKFSAKKESEKSPNADVIELKKRQEDTDKRLAESDKRICESTLRANLAESTLPEASKDRIRSRFVGKVFAESELKKEIEDEVKYCSSLAESLHPSGIRFEVGADSTDKMGDAVEGMIADVDINKVPRFKSIHEAFSRIEKINPYTPGFKDRIWIGMTQAAQKWNERRVTKEAIQTSSFAEVLGDRLHKRMVAEYSEAGLEDWRKVCTIASAPDFLTQRATRLGGYGTNMPAVAEAGTYAALTSPTDEEATYSVSKRGGLETISMEAIKNDNLKALRMIPKRLGRGCKNTLYQFVFEFINPATNPAIYDGTTLYHATHGANLRTVALAYSEFVNIAIVLMDQAGYNEANFFLDNAPKFLLVPNELWVTATEIAKSNVAFSGARTETIPNSFSEWNMEVIRVPYWTDANNYATMSDPKKNPAIEIGFLDGNEEPELLQEAANSGSDFTADQLRYKVRHIYGGAVLDYRPLVGNVVA